MGTDIIIIVYIDKLHRDDNRLSDVEQPTATVAKRNLCKSIVISVFTAKFHTILYEPYHYFYLWLFPRAINWCF